MNRATKHKNGVFYTPNELACHLVSRCLIESPRLVFDPACGEFSLLMAAKRHYGLTDDRLYGCDKRKIKTKGLAVRYQKCDFFKFQDATRFDLVVTNPPYVKGNQCPKSCREWYAQRRYVDLHISRRADFWVYFILKCVDHISDGGTLAAILPWSFFQSDYSRNVRAYLTQVFGRVDIQVLTMSHFADTPQKVILLWLYKKGQQCNSIRVCCSDDIAEKNKLKFQSLSTEDWIAGDHLRGVEVEVSADNGSSLFGTYCDVKIGIVPGATKFFIRTQKQVQDIGAEQKDYLPIITKGKCLSTLDASDIDNDVVLCSLKITSENKGKFAAWIHEAEEVKYHKRRHCRNRAVWYELQYPERLPDAFFTYRASSVPLLMLNDISIQCTNSIHGIYFRDSNLSNDKKRWLQVSLLIAYSLADLELKARTYGKNVLKIEPTALKKVRVYCPDGPISKTVLNKISSLLRSGLRERAVVEATKYVFKAMGLGARQQREIISAYNKLREQRIGKKDCAIKFGI